MNMIKNNSQLELIVKKSKFISICYNINNIEEINEILIDLKIKYKDATHICYAYIINNKEKCYDDNEPSGTAGLPILNILKNNNLTNVLAVVIRYFGGIKLGAGGLIRAYAKVTKENLKTIELVRYIEEIEITLKTDYDYLKKLDKITSSYKVIDKNYDTDIIYRIKLPKTEENNLINKINNTKITRI